MTHSIPFKVCAFPELSPFDSQVIAGHESETLQFQGKMTCLDKFSRQCWNILMVADIGDGKGLPTLLSTFLSFLFFQLAVMVMMVCGLILYELGVEPKSHSLNRSYLDKEIGSQA